MIPERNLVARSAKSVLFEEFNDIDIFIEDTAHGYVKLFTEIFSRLFDGKYKVSNVFPLGGRDAVVSQCQSNQGGFKRPTLYVIDGDLHLISDDQRIELEGLYELPFYCIENILVDKAAILEIMNEEDAEKLREQIDKEFNFDEWVRVNAPLFSALFVEYAVCFKFCPDIKTVSFPVTDLVSSNKGILDSVKVEDRIQKLRNSILQKIDEQTYLNEKQLCQSRINRLAGSILGYVSGKDYLLPLMITRTRSIVKTKCPNINLKLRLAMKCNLDAILDSKLCVAG